MVRHALRNIGSQQSQPGVLQASKTPDMHCMRLEYMYIRLKKHLQCEKLLGLAGGTTKKRRNKKSDESITKTVCIVVLVSNSPLVPARRQYRMNPSTLMPTLTLYIDNVLFDGV